MHLHFTIRLGYHAAHQQKVGRVEISIGQMLGQYRLLEEIGKGGMGIVYKAQDTRLRRMVAIKVLPPEATASDARRERFIREAQTASALNNQHIVTIHDIRNDSGVDYIVMEYVEGRTLRQVIDAGELTLAKCYDYGKQIAAALSAAHAAGIVHRDLKPNNVMMTATGLVKVLDFGLAKLSDSGADPSTASTITQLTHAGTIMGTPAYMSPEQAQGHTVDARSDIFSLGIVLYEMAAGRRPFRGDTIPALVHDIVYGEPAPVTQLNANAPRDLDTTLQRALSKRAEERFQSVDELRDALVSLSSGTPIAWGGVTRRRLAPAGRWLRRHVVLAAITAVIAIAIALALTVPATRRAIATRLAFAPIVENDPYRLYALSTPLVAAYYKPENLDRAIELLQRAVSKKQDYAAAYAGLAEAHRHKFRENNDQALMEKAVQYARHAVELDDQLVLARVVLADVTLQAGRKPEADSTFQLALKMDPLNSNVHLGLARLRQAQGRRQEAEAECKRAIELAPEDWSPQMLLGKLYYESARYPEAEAAFLAGVDRSPDNPLLYRNLGAAQHMQGRFPDAAAAFQKSLAIKPDPILYSNLGTLYFFQGLYTQAASALEKAVQLSPNNYMFWSNLADVYRQIPDRGSDAGDAYLRAIQLLRE